MKTELFEIETRVRQRMRTEVQEIETRGNLISKSFIIGIIHFLIR